MPDLSFLDVFHFALLLLTCFACYVAGRAHGAYGFAMLLISHDVIDEKALDKIRKKIIEDEE